MLYAHTAGLDLEQYLAAIRNGAAGSKSLELYSGRILSGDMAPGFMVKVSPPPPPVPSIRSPGRCFWTV